MRFSDSVALFILGVTGGILISFLIVTLAQRDPLKVVMQAEYILPRLSLWIAALGIVLAFLVIARDLWHWAL